MTTSTDAHLIRSPNEEQLAFALREGRVFVIPPAKPGGRPRTVDMRQVLNALFYLARTGCAWRMLPKDTVYYFFKRFRQGGTWERIHDLSRKRVRVQHGKRQQPSAAIIDSQSVKTTETRGLVAATTPGKR